MVVCVVETPCELMALSMMPAMIVNIILAASRSRAPRIRIDASNPIIRVISVLTPSHFVHASPRLKVGGRRSPTSTNLVLRNINRTTIVASLTQTTSFGSRSSIPYVDILRNSIGLQTTLSLHRCQQWIANILANDSSSSSYDARAGLDVGAGEYAAIVDHVVATSCKVQVDVVVVVLICRFCKGADVRIVILKCILLLH